MSLIAVVYISSRPSAAATPAFLSGRHPVVIPSASVRYLVFNLHAFVMSSFEIQVYCYTPKIPSNEHHHLESPINILSSPPTDPPPSQIITRARGGTRDNHVSYAPTCALKVTQPFERRSYCHGIIQSDGPWPNEKGDKVWLRSDGPLLVGHRGVPAYNITKEACYEVWIDNVDWRWDKQSIPTSLSWSENIPRNLILAGPARAVVSRFNNGGGRPDTEFIQMVIISDGTSFTRQREKDRNRAPLAYRHMPPLHQTRHRIFCLTGQELEEEWKGIVGRRASPFTAGSNNNNDTITVKRKGVLETSLTSSWHGRGYILTMEHNTA